MLQNSTVNLYNQHLPLLLRQPNLRTSMFGVPPKKNLLGSIPGTFFELCKTQHTKWQCGCFRDKAHKRQRLQNHIAGANNFIRTGMYGLIKC